jgi:hypothetical protein
LILYVNVYILKIPKYVPKKLSNRVFAVKIIFKQ